VADVDPKKPKTVAQKIAQLVRMLSTTGNERRNAWAALVLTMQSEGIDWSDIGNWIERGDPEKCSDGEFTEAELQEFGKAMREAGVKEGIAIGKARGNGHLTLPQPVEMAEYCHGRAGQLRDDKQREFVSDILVIAQRGGALSRGRLGYLASLYIQHGGKI
jgi:hypothetical protein